jgi:hypothetical protein
MVALREDLSTISDALSSCEAFLDPLSYATEENALERTRYIRRLLDKINMAQTALNRLKNEGR